MAAMENNVEYQRRWTVLARYSIGYFPIELKNLVRTYQKKLIDMMFTCCPVKIVAMHHCHKDFKESALTQKGLVLLPSYVRLRYRGHVGSDQESLFALLTYGIPQDSMPVSSDGTIETSKHLEELRVWREKESAELVDALV